MQEDKMPTINITYTRNKNFVTTPASGVWGGITPHGLITAEFFLEKKDLPNKTTVEINDEGKVIRENAQESNNMVRELMSNVILTPEVAKAVGEWLIATANECEKIKTIVQK